jgi:hypothetical protein
MDRLHRFLPDERRSEGVRPFAVRGGNQQRFPIVRVKTTLVDLAIPGRAGTVTLRSHLLELRMA